MAPRSIEIIIEGGPGSGHAGHLGVPGHHGGGLPSVKQGAPVTEPSADEAFVLERGEKVEYDMLRGALLSVGGQALPSGRWYRAARDSEGNAVGYLLGRGRVVVAWVSGALGDDRDFDALFEADEAEQGLGPDIRESIQYQLSKVTDEQAARWCAAARKEVANAQQLAGQWDVWTMIGLAQLLFVRTR